MDDKTEIKIINMPKLEFHGHLNGIISSKTLDKYIKDEKFKKALIEVKENFCYKSFFNAVRMVSEFLAKDEEFKLVALEDIVEEYINERCIYLEIRDTPKYPDNSKYLNDILNKIHFLQETYSDKIVIRFYLNLHRNRNCEDILKAYDSLPFHLKEYIIGIDIGGYINDEYNYFNSNKHIYNYFKLENLSLNFHIYEEVNDKYFKSIMELCPDRVSQAVYLNNPEELDLLIKTQAVLEICPSFALFSTKRQSLKQFDNYLYLIDKKHPILIGTDNRYILNTTLTKEYIIASKLFDNYEQFYDFIFSSLKILNNKLFTKVLELWNKIINN